MKTLSFNFFWLLVHKILLFCWLTRPATISNNNNNLIVSRLLFKAIPQFGSVQCSCSVVSDSLRPMNHSTPGFPVLHYSPVCSNTCPLSRWCHPIISFSITPFSSCPQSFPASGSFPMSWLFASLQSIGASPSVLSMNIQYWSPLGWTGWISLQSKGLSSLLQHHSSKASIFGAQPSLWSNSHIHTWLLEKL